MFGKAIDLARRTLVQQPGPKGSSELRNRYWDVFKRLSDSRGSIRSDTDELNQRYWRVFVKLSAQRGSPALRRPATNRTQRQQASNFFSLYYY
jgi:hypothetical protein